MVSVLNFLSAQLANISVLSFSLYISMSRRVGYLAFGCPPAGYVVLNRHWCYGSSVIVLGFLPTPLTNETNRDHVKLVTIGQKQIKKGRKKRKTTPADVAIRCNILYAVASCLSWSWSTCNPEMDIMRIRGSPRLLLPFKGETRDPERTFTCICP
jgi:hypothetical protein